MFVEQFAQPPVERMPAAGGQLRGGNPKILLPLASFASPHCHETSLCHLVSIAKYFVDFHHGLIVRDYTIKRASTRVFPFLARQY